MNNINSGSRWIYPKNKKSKRRGWEGPEENKWGNEKKGR